MNDLFAWNNNPRHVSGSWHRYIIPTKEKINNIPSASCTAKRKVRGDYVPQKESETGWLAKILCHRDLGSITESLINHRHIDPPTEGLLLCKYSELTFLHNRDISEANEREGSERDSEQKSGNAEAFQSIKRSNQRHKSLKLNSKFFFFVSLFLFSCPKKEKVNKEQTISKVLSDKFKRNVSGNRAPRKAAFTLAEVLITLGIIGVVAAMTLPTLINDYQAKETVTRLKKAYSIVNQAYLQAQNDLGTIDNWQLSNSEFEVDPDTGEQIVGDQAFTQAMLFWSKMSKYMKTMKTCLNSSGSSCETYPYLLLGDSTKKRDYAPRVILNDGTVFSGGWISNINCNEKTICADLSVDVNGSRLPNVVGRDIFYFYIYKHKIVPLGIPDEKQRPFPSYCLGNTAKDYNGYGCTAWVIYNENMDYLKCDGLSWSGKHKCK